MPPSPTILTLLAPCVLTRGQYFITKISILNVLTVCIADKYKSRMYGLVEFRYQLSCFLFHLYALLTSLIEEIYYMHQFKLCS